MPTTKGSQVRVYLQDPEFQILAKLTEITGFPQTVLSSALLSAALRAVKEEGMRLEFPFRLQVHREPETKSPVRR